MAHPIEMQQSPYFGQPDFSALDAGSRARPIDMVSVADLLRNAFVYPPHSIYRNVKLRTLGFGADGSEREQLTFRHPFKEAAHLPDAADTPIDTLVETYHRLLCEAVAASTADMSAPWMLQSGGKDSTSLAIAVAEVRPDTTCLTYLGGGKEDEVASAERVARTLGLRHEHLVCDPGRCYDRYLAAIPGMPLLTADFALLSYVDMAVHARAGHGDGLVDGLGSDSYFGVVSSRQKRLLARLAQRWRWPRHLIGLPCIQDSFELCFLLATLQMDGLERHFPGSRFSDAEVDELLGRRYSHASRRRLASYKDELGSAADADELWAMLIGIVEGGAAFPKGLYSGWALSLPVAYPYCDRRLREWVHHDVPRNRRIDSAAGINKVLVRAHIARRFDDLPYVDASKGSFRFDVVGLAKDRFDQVRSFAEQAGDQVPGATRWLDRNRRRMHNKFHASKFYVLAVVLPWLCHASEAASGHEGSLNAVGAVARSAPACAPRERIRAHVPEVPVAD